MAKEEIEGVLNSTENSETEMPKTGKRGRKATVEEEERPLINCLRNERVIVRHINKPNSRITNPKHVLYGGMAEGAKRIFCVPMLSSGRYVNVLTDDEKKFLENIMGLEPNALSIYRKVDNFWDDSNSTGISKVVLGKQDNYLDLSTPEDYIKYKILLANKEYIAPSLEELENMHKATYQFVIITESSESKMAQDNMSVTMKCYTMYGKLEDNIGALRHIVETLTGNRFSSVTKKEFLQTKINELIQANPKTFLKVAIDPMLNTKVLIKKCVEAGLIAQRGNQYYIREGNMPMCDNGDPTLNVAAQWLNLPKNQTIKLSLEAKLQ